MPEDLFQNRSFRIGRALPRARETTLTAEARNTVRQLGVFYAICLAAALLLSFGAFQGQRIQLEMGTGGYIDNLRFGGVLIVPVLLLIEYAVLALQGRAGSWDWKDSGASFAIYLFNGVLAPLTLLYQYWIMTLLEPWALFTLNDGLIPFLATFVLAEGAYYWYHRLSHEVPFLWAIHHVHHSATSLNLSIAYRLHILGRVVSPVVFVPLVLLGFNPAYLLGSLALSLVYQFFIHTRTIGKLGWLERTGFNTPSLHRVHHGSNDWCIDRNYAGVLIFWDRAFGTYQTEIGRIEYGVTTGHYSYNPFRLVVGPLVDWARGDFARERERSREPGPAP